jgi:hypothetical protein
MTTRHANIQDPLLNTAFANKHVPTSMNPHATIEELLEMEFSMQSMPRL